MSLLSSCPCVTFYICPRRAGGGERSLLRDAEHVTTPHSTSGSEHKMLRRKTFSATQVPPQVCVGEGIELVHAGTLPWGDSVRIHAFVLLDSLPGWISSFAWPLSCKWHHTWCFPVPNHRCLRSGWPGAGSWSTTAPQSIRRDVVPFDGQSQHPFSSLTVWLLLGRLLLLWEGISLQQTGLFCSVTSGFWIAKETVILNFATTTKLTRPLAYNLTLLHFIRAQSIKQKGANCTFLPPRMSLAAPHSIYWTLSTSQAQTQQLGSRLQRVML